MAARIPMDNLAEIKKTEWIANVLRGRDETWRIIKNPRSWRLLRDCNESLNWLGIRKMTTVLSQRAEFMGRKKII